MCENKYKANQRKFFIIFLNEIDLKKTVEILGPTIGKDVHLDYLTGYSI